MPRDAPADPSLDKRGLRAAPNALTDSELADLLKHRITKLQPAVSDFARKSLSCVLP